MKILIADILLHGKPHSDWKEGYEFKYAFENLGHSCDVYGPYGELSETLIPENSSNYDFVLITENYPNSSGWGWWDWASIKIPKVFWAIDTHLVDYTSFINNSGIDYVGFNNLQDIDKYKINAKKFWLPYGISSKRYTVNKLEKKYDVSFIGSLTYEREYFINKYKINHFTVYGPEYVKTMKESKICFNKSMSYDLNAKMLEIIGSGSFMLSNYSEEFLQSVNNNEHIEKMLYKDEEDFYNKMKYYLENETERENISQLAQKYILESNTFEKRAELILKNILS
jgi:spore maturation protein CgeB